MSNINLIKRLRFGTIQSGLRRAYIRLENDINSSEKDDYSMKVFNVNASICELLFWVIANHDWHNEHNKKGFKEIKKSYKEGSQKLYGLRHAYNASKHNMDFIHLFGYEGTKNFIDGLELSYTETSIIWINCPDDKKREEQVKNYRKYLKGEEVLSTFKKAIIFLNAVNNDVLFCKSKI